MDRPKKYSRKTGTVWHSGVVGRRGILVVWQQETSSSMKQAKSASLAALACYRVLHGLGFACRFWTASSACRFNGPKRRGGRYHLRHLPGSRAKWACRLVRNQAAFLAADSSAGSISGSSKDTCAGVKRPTWPWEQETVLVCGRWFFLPATTWKTTTCSPQMQV